MELHLAEEHRGRVRAFQRKHHTGVVTLLFTDIAASTQLKQDLGDLTAMKLLEQHQEAVRNILSCFAEAEEISTAGDSFFLVFVKPSDAVKFSLQLQARLREIAMNSTKPVYDRIGIHVGEVIIEDRENSSKDFYGIQVDACARINGLGQSNQILMSRFAFDNARQVLKGQELEGIGPLSWMNHGLYVFKGIDEPLEICEVGEIGKAPLVPPADSDKARRRVAVDGEPVLGWRPALGQVVPNTKWVLEQKLGEGGFGEVWLGRHDTLKELRVFKFCFKADRVRSLKREVTLFRLLKERVGQHPNIIGVQEVYFDAPPYYIVMDYAQGTDLAAWCRKHDGAGNIPLATRLEIVAQIADALQAAHQAGIIHRDVKPSNILVHEPSGFQLLTTDAPPTAKLTDFGIGQVVSEEVLGNLTKLGFTETVGLTGSPRTGTYLYMAPELLAGKPASTRSDIYSLGVVLYQLVIADLGRPVTTDWAMQVNDPLLREDLGKCFAGNPQERFATAGDLALSLRALSQRRRAIERRETEDAEQRLFAYRRGAPVLTLGVVLLVCLLRWSGFGLFERWERSSYDMRARQALKFPAPQATNLGFVFINEASVDFVRTNNAIGFHFGVNWPRQVYGRLISELAEQEAKAVALDILFPYLRDDHPVVTMAIGANKESDVLFALEMARADNVILAVNEELPPSKLPSLFATNAAALGHIIADPDDDRILRRAQAFGTYTNWQKAKPFTVGRVWHMGVVLAAQGMGLDLNKAEVDLPHGRIVLRGPGVERVIPVDRRGYFYIDWCLPPNDPRLTQESIEGLLAQSVMRLRGQTEGLTNRWRGKLAVVGSSALIGHDPTDLVPTPLGEKTLLVSEYWNVANSLLTGRFVRRAPLVVELGLIALLGILTGVINRQSRAPVAAALVALLAAVYVFLGVMLYVQTRYWIPLVSPLLGVLALYSCLAIWRNRAGATRAR